MSLDPEIVLLVLPVLLLWLLLFFLVGHREATRVRTISSLLLYGHDMTKSDLRWTFYATNISLASIFLALAVAAARSGLSAVWLVVAWLLGMWAFWAFYRSATIQSFFRQGGKTLFQFLYEAYGSFRLKRFAALLSVVIYVGSVGLEFLALVQILRCVGMPSKYLIPVSLFATVVTVLILQHLRIPRSRKDRAPAAHMHMSRGRKYDHLVVLARITGVRPCRGCHHRCRTPFT